MSTTSTFSAFVSIISEATFETHFPRERTVLCIPSGVLCRLGHLCQKQLSVIAPEGFSLTCTTCKYHRVEGGIIAWRVPPMGPSGQRRSFKLHSSQDASLSLTGEQHTSGSNHSLCCKYRVSACFLCSMWMILFCAILDVLSRLANPSYPHLIFPRRIG